jgi:hypothetical protein
MVVLFSGMGLQEAACGEQVVRPDAAREVGTDTVGDRGDDFAAVAAGVYVGAQRPGACGHGHQAYDGVGDLRGVRVRWMSAASLLSSPAGTAL